jgi:hypothetical protein
LKKLWLMLGLVAFAMTMSGCAVNRATASVDDAASLDRIKTVYVTKLPADSRGVNDLIAARFRARGIEAKTGPGKREDVDAVVTYADKWMWDITMYMIELNVMVRDPKTDFALASGDSLHTSLTRKSPQEMVDEVVDNILDKGKVKGKAQ